MALTVDGYAVLRQIGKNAELFTEIRADVSKTAQAFVIKQVKAKSTDIKALRKICKALGDEDFNLIVESMKDSAITSLIKKFDKHNPQLAVSDAGWRRKHALALATGDADPATKPEPVKRPKKAGTAKKAKPAALDRLSNEIFEALKRRD